MKAQSEATIQFSGYPLRIVETPDPKKKSGLAVIKAVADPPLSSPKNSVVNDPENWDVAWFNSYE